ncbi:MAG: acetyl-CoA carboxylase biotin carboxyl carrier protein [Verrucomicrobiota bacterium]
MDLREIRSILDLMNKHGLAEFELERKDFKIRIKRGPDGQPVVQTLPVAAAPAPAPVAAAPAPAAAPSKEAAAPAKEEGGATIDAPIVGTFYAAPSPDADDYVKPGDKVTEDSVVCIIEAMKVMNEIKAEVSGTITEVLATNGNAVEFGKALFKVKPN